MSSLPGRSSRHATPTPSRPGTPGGSRRPSLVPHNSIPSLALAHASMQSSVSPPQLSVLQPSSLVGTNTLTVFSEQATGILSSAASISGDADSSPGTTPSGLIATSHHGSSEQLNLTVSGEEDSIHRSLRPPEEVAADAHKLREHLRRSLSRGHGLESRVKTRANTGDSNMTEIGYKEPPNKSVKRQYFVLTHAGKPVFTDRTEEEADTGSEEVTNLVGVMHALISVFEDDQDKIRSIIAPPVRITFTIRPPLYYVCVSPSNEPESVARIYLEHLHLLILSVLTASQLERILTRHTNFDLRRLLSGTTTMLQTHLHQLPTSFAILTSSLNTLRLESNLRIRVADALVPPPNMKSKLKDILYAMVVVDERVVTIARPRKHTVHPTDIHILLATIGSPAVKGNTASWLPICLPKFNPNGLLHAYASYLDLPSSSTSNISSHPVSMEQEGVPEGAEGSLEEVVHLPSICLVIISASGDFETVRQWADVATQRLNEAETLKHLVKAAQKSAYSVDELGIPGLRHFYYKSRANVQVTAPLFEGFDPSAKEGGMDVTNREEEWERLFGLYRLIWDAIHAKSGQECTLKLQYVRTEKVCVMGWITQSFEIYIALSTRLPKSAAVGAANAVVMWVKQQEGMLFLRDAPVF